MPTMICGGETGIVDGPDSRSLRSFGGMPSRTLRASRAWRRCVSRVGTVARVLNSAVRACSTSSCVTVPYVNRASTILSVCSWMSTFSRAMRMRSSAVRSAMYVFATSAVSVTSVLS
jgi:hypothetical protein